MQFDHQGNQPIVADSAYVAPSAILTGRVRVEPGASILHGAILTAEFGAELTIGSNTVIMESAVLRASGPFNLSIGDSCLIGPQTYLTGCTVGRGTFLSRGVSVFNGAVIGNGCWLTINSVVSFDATVKEGLQVPAYHIVRGDTVLSPIEAASQRAARDLDASNSQFFDHVFRAGGGSGRTLDERMGEAMPRYAAALAKHAGDSIVG